MATVLLITEISGGLHRGLNASTVLATVVRAFDWDQMSCQVYNVNYGVGIAHRVCQRLLSAAHYVIMLGIL